MDGYIIFAFIIYNYLFMRISMRHLCISRNRDIYKKSLGVEIEWLSCTVMFYILFVCIWLDFFESFPKFKISFISYVLYLRILLYLYNVVHIIIFYNLYFFFVCIDNEYVLITDIKVWINNIYIYVHKCIYIYIYIYI